jgi:hypothetical protein
MQRSMLLLLRMLVVGIRMPGMFVAFGQSIPSQKSRSLGFYYVDTAYLQGGSGIAPAPSVSAFVFRFVDEGLCDNCYVEHECSAAP